MYNLHVLHLLRLNMTMWSSATEWTFRLVGYCATALTSNKEKMYIGLQRYVGLFHTRKRAVFEDGLKTLILLLPHPTSQLSSFLQH